MSVGIRKLFSIGLVALCVSAGALTLAAAPALAAGPPEAPFTAEPAEVKSTTAILQGIVNPVAAATVSWFFEYEAGSVCTGGSTTPMEGPAEVEVHPVTVPTQGLAAHTEYTVCLVVEGEGGKTAGNEVHFTTATPPQVPVAEGAEPVTATTAVLEGTLNPTAEAETGYHFIYSAGAACTGGSATVAVAPAAVPAKTKVHTEVMGLLPAQEYAVCLVAANRAGELATSSPVTFTTPMAAPVITSESVSAVEAGAATLEAEIDPEGAETTFRFEYGTTGAYGQSTLESTSIGADDLDHTASATIKGLLPGTTYHYRVVASNSQSPAGGAPGSDRTFTTSPVLGSEPPQSCANEQRRAEQPYALKLPDCRAYELVSPLDTEGQDAVDSFLSETRAAPSGEAITYASEGPFAGPAGAAIVDQMLSRRGPGAWSTQSITPPEESYKANLFETYPSLVFTPELTEGVARTTGSVTSEAPKGLLELYLHDFADGSYRWLSNVTDDEEPYFPPGGSGGVFAQGASTDLSHVVFTTATTDGFVSEWVDGKVIEAVNVDNAGQVLEAGLGTTYLERAETGDVWHAVSADGSRIFFTTYAGDEIYVRENAEREQSPLEAGRCAVPADACTIEISASQRKTADPHGPQPAHFWGASTNGEKVFFTSPAELTEDAYTGTEDNAANLYEYDLETGALKDLTVDPAAVAEGAAVQGVAQISEDGSYVYFVARGDLGGEARAGEPNLYVSHEGGAPKFIATLGEDDRHDWGNGNTGNGSGASPESTSAVVAPDGSRLAFMAGQSLTGYDNEQAVAGDCEGAIERDNSDAETGRCQEVYLYDAGTGGLECASCDPSGARPIGPSSFGVLPPRGGLLAVYRPRNLTEDGVLFFDSFDALVPHASDGRRNVYEYEDGHIHAISDVAGGYESFFLDASANGEDVFFGTADQLLPEVTSNNVAVYDARVAGGFPVTVAAPPCNSGDSCKPPPTPQPAAFGTPASAAFSGPGNVVPAPSAVGSKQTTKKAVKCRKGFAKNKRGQCVKKKKGKESGKRSKAKKASDNRRAGR